MEYVHVLILHRQNFKVIEHDVVPDSTEYGVLYSENRLSFDPQSKQPLTRLVLWSTLLRMHNYLHTYIDTCTSNQRRVHLIS